MRCSASSNNALVAGALQNSSLKGMFAMFAGVPTEDVHRPFG